MIIAEGAMSAEAFLLAELKALPVELGRTAYVVVPSHSLRTHLLARIAQAQGAKAGLSVITLRRLAFEILRRAGGSVRDGSTLFSLLLRRHARERAELTRALGALEDGYASVNAAASDLLDAGLCAAHAEGLAEFLQASWPGAVGARATEVAEVALAAQRDLLAARRVPRAGVFSAACDALSQAPSLLRARALWVYGYADVTGTQCDLLLALLRAFPGGIILDAPPNPAAPTPDATTPHPPAHGEATSDAPAENESPAHPPVPARDEAVSGALVENESPAHSPVPAQGEAASDTPAENQSPAHTPELVRDEAASHPPASMSEKSAPDASAENKSPTHPPVLARDEAAPDALVENESSTHSPVPAHDEAAPGTPAKNQSPARPAARADSAVAPPTHAAAESEAAPPAPARDDAATRAFASARADSGVVFLDRLRARVSALGVREERCAPARTPEIALFRAPGPQAEVREVAERVAELVESGVPDESIGVVARDLAPFAHALRAQFERVGVAYSGLGARVPAPAAHRVRALLTLLRERARAPLDIWLDADATFERPLARDLRLAFHVLGFVRLEQLANFAPEERFDAQGNFALPLRRSADEDAAEEFERFALDERAPQTPAPNARAHKTSAPALREGADDAPTSALREGADDVPASALRESADDTSASTLREGGDDTPASGLRAGADDTPTPALRAGADDAPASALRAGADAAPTPALRENADAALAPAPDRPVRRTRTPRRKVRGADLKAACARARELLALLQEWPARAPFAEHEARLRALLRDVLAWRDDATPGAREVRGQLGVLRDEVGARFPLGAAEWPLLLERALAGVGAERLGGAGGGVAVLASVEARARCFEHLFVIGLNRDSFPRIADEDPLLPEALRMRLEELLPDIPRKRRSYDEERYLFAQLCASSPRVTLSFSCASEDNKERPPSAFIERVRLAQNLERAEAVPEWLSARANRALPGDEALALFGLEAARSEAARKKFARAHREFFELALGEVQHALAPVAARALPAPAAWAHGRLAVARELDARAPGLDLGPYFGWLGARALTGETPVTQLEALARCPWQSFLLRELHLEALPDAGAALPALSPLLLGNLVHAVLEKIAQHAGAPVNGALALQAPGVAVAWPPARELERWTHEIAQRLLNEEGLHTPGFAQLLMEKTRALFERVRKTDWPRAGAQPQVAGAEVRATLQVECDGGARSVTFRADRADRLPAGGLLLTDYKTGKPVYGDAKREETQRKRWLLAVQRGEALQVAAYLEAGAARARYLYADPARAEEAQLSSGADADALRAAFRQSARVLLQQRAAGACAPRLFDADRESTPRACDHCTVRAACFQPDTLARQRLADWLENPRADETPAEQALRAAWELGAGE